MKKVAIAVGATVGVALVGLVLAASRYEYLERGGQSIRIHRLSGHVEVLRRATGGGMEWARVPSASDVRQRAAEDAANSRRESERCAAVALPEAQTARIAVRAMDRTSGDRVFWITNQTPWQIERVDVGGPAGNVTARYDPQEPGRQYSVFYRPPHRLLPSKEGPFTTNGAIPSGPFRVTMAWGAPGDCATLP